MDTNKFNSAAFQEYDYNKEDSECEWKEHNRPKRNPKCKCKKCKCNNIVSMEDLFNGE